MVHTRGRGARPEGFSEYQPPKLPPSAKRRRETEETADQSASKRRKALTPEQPKFLFSKTRNRSLLTSAPPKLSSRHESPYYTRIIEPASPETSPTAVAQLRGSEERTRPPHQHQEPQPETPARNAPQGGLFGSVRRIFGYFRGPAQGVAVIGGEEQLGNPADQNNDPTAATPGADEDDADEGSPSPTPKRITYEPESSIVPESETIDSKIFTREHFKRRRTANTRAGREQFAVMNEATFNPESTPGNNKRKLASVDGLIPGPQKGGFGIDDSYLDVENDVEGIGESSLEDAQPATPSNRPTMTPLRSALRQSVNTPGTIGRSTKSVRINSIPTSAKAVYGQYGPAGDYRGSTFADLSPIGSQSSNTPSSLPWDVKPMHSPDTLRNTSQNASFHVDASVTDPHDPNWRPTPANPRPGHFVLPDFDDDDEDEASSVTLDQVQGDVPSQPPSTPRMSHAELPQSSTPEPSGSTSHTDSIHGQDTHESRLNKARSEAQKYKPARSSRLSLTEQARSRSSSPPGNDSTWRESQIEVGTPDAFKPRGATLTDDTTMLSASSQRSLDREDLDDTVVGDDGMTDYQREHQHDAWAADIFNKILAQSYAEAGVATSYVDNLVQKTWTDRDTRESIEFWEREFEEGLKQAREARAQGRELVWITDPDVIVELEQTAF